MQSSRVVSSDGRPVKQATAPPSWTASIMLFANGHLPAEPIQGTRDRYAQRRPSFPRSDQKNDAVAALWPSQVNKTPLFAACLSRRSLAAVHQDLHSVPSAHARELGRYRWHLASTRIRSAGRSCPSRRVVSFPSRTWSRACVTPFGSS